MLVYSTSPATTSLIVSVLQGSKVTTTTTFPALQAAVQKTPPMFVLVDSHSDAEIEELRAVCQHAAPQSKIIQILVPSSSTVRTRSLSGSGVEVVRVLHPLRRVKLLQLLLDLRRGEEVNSPALTTIPAVVRSLDRFNDKEKEVCSYGLALRPMAVQKTILIVLSRRLHGTCDTVLQNAWPDFDRRGQCDCFSSACQGTSPSYCVETSPSTVQSRQLLTLMGTLHS